MFCRYCSAQIAEGAYFCPVCGKDLTDKRAQASPGETRTSGKAIASLVCGLFLFFFPVSIAAVVLGHLALSEIRKSAGRLQGHALAVAGLVLGYLGIASIPVMLIFLAIAIPNLLRARIAANEVSASQIVRQLVAAETSYAAEHPEKGYTCDLHEVVNSGDLDPAIAAGPRYGYSFALQNCGAPASAPNSKFEVVAYPIRLNQTGRRTFCADQSGVVRADSSGFAQACLESGSPL